MRDPGRRRRSDSGVLAGLAAGCAALVVAGAGAVLAGRDDLLPSAGWLALAAVLAGALCRS